MVFERSNNRVLIGASVVVLCFSLLFAGIGVATAKEIYVATWGSDSGAGTIEEPWQHPAYAAKVAEAGDTIYLLDCIWYNEQITFANSGTESQPIVMKAYDGSPTLYCVRPEKNKDVGINIRNKAYITIDGITVRHYWEHIFVRQSEHIHILNCAVYTEKTADDPNQEGISMRDGTHDSTIENCLVDGDAWNSIGVYGLVYDEGWQYEESSNIIISHCTVRNNSLHNLIDLSGIVDNICITDNTLYNGRSGTIYNHQGFTSQIYVKNNIIYDSSNGIYFDKGTSDSIIENNRIYGINPDGGHSIHIRGGSVYGDTTFSSANNIIRNNYCRGDVYYEMICVAGEDNLMEHNDAHSDFGDIEYRLGGGNNIIRNAVGERYKVRSDGGKVAIEYTDGNAFSIDGSGNYTTYTLSSGVTTIELLDPLYTTPDPPEDNATVGYWKFDEGSENMAHDSSGNGNDGTIYGASWTEGKEGKGLSFDGTDDYVLCSQDPSLALTGAITVEAWVKWTGDGDPYFVTKTGDSGHRSYDLSGNADGTVEFRVGGSDCNTIKSSGTTSILTGEWVHLVGTYEPSSYVRLFVNGALAAEETTSIPAAQGDNGLSWYMGAREGNQGWFNGLIDEVKIYNRALSAEEVREEYTPNKSPFSPGNPSPSDGATDVSIAEALSWTGGDPDAGDTVTYNVYFGTSMTQPLVAENQSGTTYGPGTLNYSTEYYWRIVATDNHGAATEGEVWSFVTASALDPGLVADWHLDEGSGLTAVDSSGNSNDGNLVNNPTWVNGKVGKGLSFDGTDDYVYCGQDSSLKITGAITVEAWVNWSGAANPYIVTKTGDSGHRSYDLSGNADGTVEFRVGGTDCNTIKSSGTVPIPTGEWVSLVGTYEPSSYVRLFVNGALAAEETTSIPAAQGDNGLPWYIGAREGAQGSFNGVIDEVKIYTGALSAEEVREEYTPNKSPFSPGNPSPSDGATDVSIDEALSWTGGDPDAGDTVTYNVYFGTSMTQPLVAENQSGTTYGPGTLNYSTEYYWRIVATDNHGAATEGEVWSFVTASALDPGLVADWHLDEGSGLTAVDSSGNSNDGNLVNNPTWVNGKVGKGLSFDGTDDYVYCGQDSSLKITGAITVEAWVKWTGDGDPYFVTKTGDSGHRSYDLSGNADGTVEFRVGGSDCNTIKSSGTTSILTGEWVHLVGTYEPSSYVRLFVNGALAAEETTSIPAAQGDNGLSWYMGAREGNQGWFNGLIDEVKIYNRALSAEEVREEYTPNKSPFSPGNPSPSDGATDVSIDEALSWTGGDPDAGDTVTYNVYFGTSMTQPLVAENQSGTTYGPGTLNYSTEYYWRIVATDNHGAATEGEVWSFVTASALDPGLVADWHLDEGSGLTAVDSSGNSNDGNLVNNPTWVNGKVGKGLSFDGTNDYVDCGRDSSLKITGAITVEAWVNWSGAANPYIVTKTGDSGHRSYDLSGNADGTVEFRVGGTDCNTIKSSGTVPIPTGEWVSLVGTYEPSSYVRLFVNGALAAEETTSIPAAQGDNGLPWYIGAREGAQGSFNGVIDEVKIYTGALSAEEVREEYTPNKSPFSPGNPSPSDGATDVSIDEALSWTGGDPDAGDTVTYNVYFGTSMTQPLVAENQSGTTYGPGTLNYSTEYYWRIVATDNHGAATEGEVWSFVTASALDPGLVADWHLDEGSGLTAVDSSGNSNDGNLVNNPTWVNGKVGKGLSFDGTDDYVYCGQDSSLKITGAITVEAWVNWSGAANPYIVTKTGDSGHRSYDLSGNADGTVEFRVGGTDCNTIKSSGTVPIPTGEWVSLVGTYEPSSYVRLFVNGALAAEETTSIPAAQGDNGLPWYIGAREGAQGSFNGVIDEVKIYNRVLSEEEVRAIYRAYILSHQRTNVNDSITPDTAKSGNHPPDADPKSSYTGTERIKYIWLEAENATVLTPDFEIASDTSASNGGHIQIPDRFGFRASDGEATYTISIDLSDNYVIWGRKIAATKCDNSFFVQIDDGTRYDWTTALSEDWEWDAVNHWGKGEEFNPECDPVVFSLSAGEHTLRIIQREGGAKLDRLLITNDLSYVPW